MPITFPQKPGIVAYLTAGDPSLAATRDIALAALDNGVDVILSHELQCVESFPCEKPTWPSSTYTEEI